MSVYSLWHKKVFNMEKSFKLSAVTLDRYIVLGCKQQYIYLLYIANIGEGALKFMPEPINGYYYIVVKYSYLD